MRLRATKAAALRRGAGQLCISRARRQAPREGCWSCNSLGRPDAVGRVLAAPPRPVAAAYRARPGLSPRRPGVGLGEYGLVARQVARPSPGMHRHHVQQPSWLSWDVPGRRRTDLGLLGGMNVNVRDRAPIIHTEEVTGSNPVSPTRVAAAQRGFRSSLRGPFSIFDGRREPNGEPPPRGLCSVVAREDGVHGLGAFGDQAA
jgi:hypothetical protein